MDASQSAKKAANEFFDAVEQVNEASDRYGATSPQVDPLWMASISKLKLALDAYSKLVIVPGSIEDEEYKLLKKYFATVKGTY